MALSELLKAMNDKVNMTTTLFLRVIAVSYVFLKSLLTYYSSTCMPKSPAAIQLPDA